MAILETKVEIRLKGTNSKHFESLGYNIPKSINKYGKLTVPEGTKISVKIDDISTCSSIKITKICDNCGKYIFNQKYCDVIKHRNNGKDSCFECGRLQSGISKKKNLKYEKSLEYFALQNNKSYLLEEFSLKNSKNPNEINYCTNDIYWWDCPDCKSEYEMPVGRRTNLHHLSNCPYCCIPAKRVNHTNCLWTTHPHIAKLLKNPQRGYELTAGSESKEDFVCNDCGYVLQDKTISNISKRGISCPKCSDGVSYPEKFMFAILEQLNIPFSFQKVFSWSDNKKYDFYISSLKCIIEVNGKQHYQYTGRGRPLEEEQENDRLKEILAKENGIVNYIVIDCYESKLQYIKDNISNSSMHNLFDIKKINWELCHEKGLKSLVKVACDIWNNGIKSTTNIGEEMKIASNTVCNYLKQGAELGWCDYNSDKARRNVYSERDFHKQTIVQLSMNNEYIKEWESIKEATETLCTNNISNVCNGKRKTAGGYKWMYKDDYIKNKDNLKIYKAGTSKQIVRLDMNNNLLDIYYSLTDASNAFNINTGRISEACKGKRDFVVGFKWMYKKDYDLLLQNQNIINTTPKAL